MRPVNRTSPAETFDNFFGPALFVPWAAILLERANLQSGERVLDLACGTGTVARQAAVLAGKDGRVTGVDINPGMLEVARSQPTPDGAPIQWKVGDAAQLDFADSSFDLVVCQQGLQFFRDRWAALKEVQRVLRPGGRLALNVWQVLERHPVFAAILQAEAKALDVPLVEVSAPFLYPDAQALRSLLQTAGYQNIQISSESFDALFPSAEGFVETTLYAAIAILPEFDPNDEALFTGLVRSVSAEIQPVLEQHIRDGRLVVPMHCNIAVAYR